MCLFYRKYDRTCGDSKCPDVIEFFSERYKGKRVALSCNQCLAKRERFIELARVGAASPTSSCFKSCVAYANHQCFECRKMLSPSDFRWTQAPGGFSRSKHCYECIAEIERYYDIQRARVDGAEQKECRPNHGEKFWTNFDAADGKCFGCKKVLSSSDFRWTDAGPRFFRSDYCYECIAEQERNHEYALLGRGKVQCATCDATSLTDFDRNSQYQWYERCRACQHPPCCQCGKRS